MVLCDMPLRGAPVEDQIRDIASWLHVRHNDSTCLSTNSLLEAEYPGAFVLGEEVCGMAAISITSKDFLIWFCSHVAKEIKWGGAKHDPIDKGDRRKMYPRTSFKAFLEVVKRRSLPWEDVEMDAIHSLHQDINQYIVGIFFVGQDIIGQKLVMDKYTRVQRDYIAIVQISSALIPPIFMIDENRRCSEWNESIQKLIGLKRDKAVGQEGDKVVFGFFNKKDKYLEALLSVNERMDAKGKIIGVLAFLHMASSELQHALQVQRMSEEVAKISLKELAYVRREIRNPFQGITFI
ncbi:hypothetical protein GIB67_021274 [Kingdonia uniflora]|uniref:PAS domain-containing protein n=1 Tax=Kingdonia uniflora TaxID=39325 RepID=A0A7J7LFX1_9MAGN|nr:hypothetical protein GIB67_021274 [Kingdonia uniflora]